MLPEGELFNRNGRVIQAEWLKGSTMIPTPDPRFVLEVRLEKTSAKIAICATADCKPIDRKTGFEELLPPRINSGHDIRNALLLGSEWRVQFQPDLKRIITLPAGNDRLVSHAWDFPGDLKSRQEKYLFLESVPPLAAIRGETLEYRLQVQTNGKKVRIALEDGPAGAKLTKKNQLRWKVPTDHAEAWARFLLTVSNADGQELFHSFEVAIQPPAEN